MSEDAKSDWHIRTVDGFLVGSFRCSLNQARFTLVCLKTAIGKKMVLKPGFSERGPHWRATPEQRELMLRRLEAFKAAINADHVQAPPESRTHPR